jgi:hypothetical protein
MAPLYKGAMKASTRADLEQRRAALLGRLQGLPNLMRGSVYERWHKCGRAACGCAGAGPKHLTRQLTVTLDGRTHTRYVRVEEVEHVQGQIATYHELWAIVNALTAVNLALLRRAPAGGRAGRKRRAS